MEKQESEIYMRKFLEHEYILKGKKIKTIYFIKEKIGNYFLCHVFNIYLFSDLIEIKLNEKIYRNCILPYRLKYIPKTEMKELLKNLKDLRFIKRLLK